MLPTLTIHEGHVLDVLKGMESESVNCVVTSPPYWGLRDYGVAGQFGLEKTPERYVASMVAVFREARRVMRIDGTCWLNLGDTYAGGGNNHGNGKPLHEKQQSNRGALGQVAPSPIPNGLKAKDMVGIPRRVAFALQADGWWLRSDIIWSKPNPMPESVTDRPTKSHEYIFLLTKSQKYFFDADAVKESATESGWNRQRANGNPHQRKTQSGDKSNADSGTTIDSGGEFTDRNIRSVWTITTHPFTEAHFATFPPKLVETCVKAGTKTGDVVLDPFCGSGTTGVVALRLGRNFVGVELNPEYVKMATNRIRDDAPLLNTQATGTASGPLSNDTQEELFA